MKKFLFIFSISVLAAVFQILQAQNLVLARKLGGSSTQSDVYGRSIIVDALENIYTFGTFSGPADFDPGPNTFHLTAPVVYSDIFISKLDAFGNFIWARQISGTSTEDISSAVIDASGNLYLVGTFSGTADFDPGIGTYNMTAAGGSGFILKLNAEGNFIWANKIGGFLGAIEIDDNEDFYVTGYFQGTTDFDPGSGTFSRTSFGYSDVFIAKLDSAGTFIWAKQLGGGFYDHGNDITIDASGNIYATGFFQDIADFDPGPAMFNLISAGTEDVFIVKLSTNGDFIWAKQFGGTLADHGFHITCDADGGVYATGKFWGLVDFDPSALNVNLTSSGDEDIFITKFSDSGDLLWANRYGGPRTDHLSNITLDTAGNLYTVGYFQDTAVFAPGVNLASIGFDDIFITHIDAAGNLIWAKQLGSLSTDQGCSIFVDTHRMLYVTGSFRNTVDFDPSSGIFNLSSNSVNAFVLKLTRTTPYAVHGNIFADGNVNCIIDTSDYSLPGMLIKAEPGPYYGMSDIIGNYSAYILDTGNYTISLVTLDPLWQPTCTTSYNIQLSGTPDTTTGIDFSLQASVYCPRLSVELGAPLLRRCFNNTYTFAYRNTGTLPSSNAYIEVDFGDYLQPQSSTLTWSTVSGNIYTFPIGNLNINQQGSFNVTALLDCAADLGSTQCVTAHIYPDSLCLPPPIGWDKSETAVSGTCVNDSLVCFTIKNRSSAGGGDMAGAAQWRLYVNDTLITQGAYQLAGGDSIVKCFPANGKTYRLEADQNLPHPRRSKPQAIVEACGSPTTFGFVNTVPQDDEELAVETFCMTVIGSFDPNDKQVSPVGITSNNYITADDELEHLIRFQNTGTDTAFKVVIRDTIATDVLDIATLTSGASSHDYTFNIYGQGIAEWTFDNILLPDSFVNEPASHGFVQFKIRQLPGNADGTLIENSAAIYFDFNAPVITNTAWNEVNEAQMPVSFFSATTTSSCPDTSGGDINVAVSGGLKPYTYQWSSGQTNSSISNLSQGVYSVTVTDEAESIFVDTINIPSPLVTSISTQNSVTCFGDNDAAAKANPAGGVSPYSALWSDGQTDFTANDLSAGNYQVTVTDSNGCQLITSITIQDGYQVPAGTITGADSADINQTATYSVNAGLSYAWSVTNGAIISGQGTNSVEVEWSAIGQGTVEVAVADGGCTETVSKTITLVDPTGMENDLLNAIELYPNPTNGTITVRQIPSLAGMESVVIKLYDSIGKQVLQQTATHLELQQGIVFDLNERDEGIYFFSIQTEKGTRVMKVVRY